MKLRRVFSTTADMNVSGSPTWLCHVHPRMEVRRTTQSAIVGRQHGSRSAQHIRIQSLRADEPEDDDDEEEVD